MPRSLEAVFFDAGETLIHPRVPLHELYMEAINRECGRAFSPGRVLRAMEEVGRALPLEVDGHFRYSDGWFEVYIHTLLDRLECPGPYDGIAGRLLELFDDPATFRVFPDAAPCLEEVRRRGLKTAVVSNWGFRLSRLLDRLGLGEAFDAVVASADVRSEKPEGTIFREALARTGADPGRVIHVGDDAETDLEGARRAGLHALLLDRREAHPEERSRIRSLRELLSHL